MSILNPNELRVDTFKSIGSNWLHIPNGVRVTHIPTGIYAESTESRSQHLNRNHCFNKLEQLLKQHLESKNFYTMSNVIS